MTFQLDENTQVSFVPYSPFNNLTFNINPNKKLIAFGHWEITDFSKISGVENLNEYGIQDIIIKQADIIVTGHEHKPNFYSKIKTYVTGSMQPYAHGEQLKEEILYKTESLSTVVNNLTKDVDIYSNVNLRIILDTDEDPLKNINCLSLSYLYNKKETKQQVVNNTEEDGITSDADISALSFNSLIFKRFAELSKIDERFSTYLQNAFLNKTYQEWTFENE